MEFDDSEAIKQAVASGLGIAYLSLSSLRLELAAGEISVLDVAGSPCIAIGLRRIARANA